MKILQRCFIFIFLNVFFLTGWSQINTFPKYEMRAVWLTTYANLDWPKHVARTPKGVKQQKEELKLMLDKLQAVNINTVFFQVRMRGTSLYPSKYEPWDKCLTGIPGRDPEYDPLAFAVEECHKRGMQLHAWMVSFPLCDFKTARRLGKKATSYKVRELCKRGKEKWYLDPGMPGTAHYLAKIVSEVVDNYDVDGIHLDYIRYPEPILSFSDYTTYRKYGNKQSKKEWRRNNVTHCVEVIHKTIKEKKPWICFSCAPIGKFTNLTSYSSQGWDAYNTVYQDAQKWLNDGIMDLLAPMMYFKGRNFYPFALDWKEQSVEKVIAPGLGIYFLDRKIKDWPLSDILRELYFLRNNGMSQAYFRVDFLNNNTKGLYDFLKNEFYSEPALIPPLKGFENETPTPPRYLKIEKMGNKIRLIWEKPNLYSKESGISYRLYRAINEEPNVSLHKNLLCDRIDSLSYIYYINDPEFASAHFAVTAVDRFGNESAPALFPISYLKNTLPKKEIHLLKNDGSQVELPFFSVDYVLVEDALGRPLYTCRYQQLLNISHLKSGLYTFRSLNENGTSHIIGKTFVTSN